MADIYQEHILDHYSRPRNKGVIDSPDIYYKDSNPLCGDEIAMYAKLAKPGSDGGNSGNRSDSGGRSDDGGVMENRVIAKAGFIARGCAISQAAASMLTERVEGKSVEAVYAMSADDVLGMLMIPVSHARMKCAVLALKTLQAGIAVYFKTNKTRGA
ncbi:iron-sulfur cluster assembly scaffold protein [Candidatus Woesearchaeota archaeon]|nr:iron-sulfur cluster assembly scaffold protein [Candidatus Woesearchaeota archaeon]